MALPSVQRAKLETFRAAEAAGQPAPIATKPSGPTAVVSMIPGPREPAPASEEPLDINAFSVEPVAAEPSAPPAERKESLSEEEQEEARQQKWKTEAPELFHKFKTVAGMYERLKSDHAALKDDVKALKQEIETLKKAPPAPVPVPVAKAPTRSLVEELDEGVERDTYKDSAPVVAKLSKRVAEEVHEQLVAPLRAEIEELRKAVGKVDSIESNQRESETRSFYNNVRSRIKDIDEIVASPDWAEYVSKKVPYSPNTFAQVIQWAHDNRDLDTLVEVFNGFKKKEGDSLESLVTPPVSRNTTDPVRQSQQKPMLKFSERKKASDDFRKGRISKARLDQIDQLYKQAEAEGRVDMRA